MHEQKDRTLKSLAEFPETWVSIDYGSKDRDIIFPWRLPRLETSGKPARRFSPAMQIFSCSLTVKQSISIEMNNDNDLKFA